MLEVIQLSSQVKEFVVEPLTADDLVTCLRLGDAGDQRDHLAALAIASRQAAEKYTGRVLLGAVAFRERIRRDRPYLRHETRRAESVALSRGPLVAVTSVKANGVPLDLASLEIAGGDNVLPKIYLPWTAGWQLLEVEYTAGVGLDGTGDDAKALPTPELAVLAMKLIAGHFEANRESQDIPPGAMRLLDLVGKLEA